MSTNTLTDITSRALLVHMHISSFGGARKDKEATASLSVSMGVSEDDAYVSKYLLSKEDKAKIASCEGRLRQVFMRDTLPWLDSGARILPVELFARFNDQFSDARLDWEQAVDELIGRWDDILAKAPARLGQLYKKNELPSADEARRMFKVKLRRQPLPKGEDYRINMSEQMMTALRQEVEDDMHDAAKETTLACFARVKHVITTMVEGLERHGVVKPGAKKAQFFTKGTLENVEALVDVLDALNITNDQSLTNIASDVRVKMTAWTADMLKDDDQLRADVAKDGRDILSDIDKAEKSVGGFFGLAAE